MSDPVDRVPADKLEARFVADLLSHIEQRSDEYEAWLSRIEGQSSVGDDAAVRLQAEATVLHSKIKRLQVATTLVSSFLELRRHQLESNPEGAGRR